MPMIDSEQPDYATLSWVKGSIDESLHIAQKALEEFISAGYSGEGMHQYVNQLHQVHGTLRMVQIYGAAMLVEELEHIGRLLANAELSPTEGLIETLMLGVIQLPPYLRRIENGVPDIPLVLLPVVNELRLARNASPASEVSVYAPNLERLIEAEPVIPGSGSPSIGELVHKLRNQYHKGLLEWYRDENSDHGLRKVLDVVRSINARAGTLRLRSLMDAAEALTLILISGEFSFSNEIKRLYGRLDRIFKRLMDSGEESTVTDFPRELYKNLLYFVARSNSTDLVVLSVRKSADLANSFSADTRVDRNGADLDALDAVKAIVLTELNSIKETFDLFVRGDQKEPERLANVADVLDQLGDTLGMVGRGVLRDQLRSCGADIRGIEEQRTPVAEESLVQLASNLLSVETALSHPYRSSTAADDTGATDTGAAEQLVNQDAVIKETFTEVSRIKTQLGIYLQQSGDETDVGQILADLSKLTGVFDVAGMSAVSEMLAEVTAQIQILSDTGLSGFSPAQREAMVDFFAGLDYYLETRVLHGTSQDQGLDYLRQALDRLTDEQSLELQTTSFFAPSEKPIAIDSELVSDLDLGTEVAPETDLDAGLESVAESTVASQTDEVPDKRIVHEEAAQPVLDSELPERESRPTEASVETTTEEEMPEIQVRSIQLEEIDPEIFEIFMEEAAEVVESVQASYPRWRKNQGDDAALHDFRRSFHTLKGSGRMVGALTIGEFAWSIENLLNRLLEDSVQVDERLLDLMDDVVAVLPQLIQGQAEGKMPDVNLPAMEARAFALAEGKPETPAEISAPAHIEEIAELETAAEAAAETLPALVMEQELYEIFNVEALTHLATIESYLHGDAAGSIQVEEDLARALHTLRGSSHLAEVDCMASLSDQMEGYCSHLRQLGQPMGADGLEVLKVYHQYMKSMLKSINVADMELPDWQSLRTAISLLSENLPEVISELQEPLIGAEAPVAQNVIDPEMLEIFLEETAELTEQLYQSFIDWSKDSKQQQASDSFKRGLHTLKGSARLAGVDSLGDLIGALESLVEQVVAQNIELTEDVQDMIRHTLDQTENTLDMLHLNSPLPDLSMLTRQLESMSGALSDHAEPESLLLEDAAYLAEPESILLSEKWTDETESIGLSSFTESLMDVAAETPGLVPEVDPELLEIFLEEAAELSEKLEQGYTDWEQDISDKQIIDGLMRTLHTFKGNARFAGMFELGDLSHSLESLFEGLSSDEVAPKAKLIPLVRESIDKLELSVDQLQRQQPVPAMEDLIKAVSAAVAGKAWKLPDSILGKPKVDATRIPAQVTAAPEGTTGAPTLPPEIGLVGKGADVLPFPTSEGISFIRPFKRPPPMRAEAVTAGRGERVRVRSELLDQLVNNAGEVSIYRARLEQQNNSVGHNLEELTQTIGRLQMQLRGLERETEAQVLSRYERDHETSQYADFDPLEMDRYSTMQQLSRALSETISDLSDIGETLDGLSRDTDTLLLQQSRITNDLQDGLLRTRMVPFSRQATRLQRVVRQTAKTLNKKADLVVQGAEGEIDRSILNQMMGPLEHLLRNAVSHGVEIPKDRLKLGKPEEGKVTLILAREGGEIVITLTDDGRGLDPEHIRKLAIEKGLLAADAKVTESALFQFILAPGFTTAKKITQVAGRGVGMDAVMSELKKMGGSLEIESQVGQGSSFIIRLPFTLAISDALLVKAADEVFAVPHGNAEQVIRATRQDLLACYSGQSSGIAYAGHEYPVRYLGAMLGLAEPVLPSTGKWYPVLLVRSGEQRMAIQLDHLIGNYQVVVKSLGGQLGGVNWFTGGTILADGEVALLLDLRVLVRSDVAQQTPIAEAVEEEEVGVTVMVVDDSITVRKVTGRMLERHNMKVVTAKDGVDAVTVLQDILPDVMLLDIEMPRMDGYELARHVRNTPELKHIPIIMITSRTGEKHRDRAMELGVNEYLGKPFQEAELLDNIHTLLADHAHE